MTGWDGLNFLDVKQELVSDEGGHRRTRYEELKKPRTQDKEQGD